jgi:hypothetical protein
MQLQNELGPSTKERTMTETPYQALRHAILQFPTIDIHSDLSSKELRNLDAAWEAIEKCLASAESVESLIELTFQLICNSIAGAVIGNEPQPAQ